MKVTIIRSGGVGGLTITKAADSESLGAQDAEDLASAVEKSGIYDLPREPAEPPRHRDRFQYSVTIEDGEVFTVSINEEDCSPEFLSLIALVDRLS